jgi:hypothetical protein
MSQRFCGVKAEAIETGSHARLPRMGPGGMRLGCVVD